MTRDPFDFVASEAVTRIRDGLDHPIIDGDGHLLEFIPVVTDLLAEVAGPSMVERFRNFLRGAVDPDQAGFARARVFWGLPERNTLDRMTVTLPGLSYRRMDELGLDFALLYPSFGLTILAHPDAELRQAVARALNRYYAEEYADYRDRLEPVAVIPSFSPAEAIEELEHAVGALGLKAVVMNAVIPRSSRPDGSSGPWLDTLGHESLYDYDPLWAKCAELGVAPTFHGIGYGWGTRFSTKNYVYNHLGNFAAAQEAACRSLFMGGVPKRFPQLCFGFLEGGVAWGCQLFADILGHYEKRNREVVSMFDPREFDLELCGRLLDRFARGRIADRRKDYENTARRMKSMAPGAEETFDDFAESGITSPEDIVEIFARQFHFGCEADDPMNALSFDRQRMPYGIRLNAIFASDIGHWDVPDMREILPEAWELVEKGLLSREDFRHFTCGNVVRLMTAANPRFFEGTAVADAVRGVRRDGADLAGSKA